MRVLCVVLTCLAIPALTTALGHHPFPKPTACANSAQSYGPCINGDCGFGYICNARTNLCCLDSTNVQPVDVICAKRMTMKQPRLLRRFDKDFLIGLCEKSRLWLQEANTGATNPKLTQAQVTYFHSVTTCQSVECICDHWPECRQLANKLNFTKIYDKQKKNNNANRGQPQVIDSAAEKTILEKYGRVTRKEIRAMSDAERNRFFAALDRLKSEKIDNMTKYDILIAHHNPKESREAHSSGAFLPFHREYLRNIEVAMRMVDPLVSLPYWDSTLDANLPVPADSILWSQEFLGNGDGEVITGPFANWTTFKDPRLADLSPRRKIVRNVGRSKSIFRESDLREVLSKPNFRSLVYCLDSFFEASHGANHVFVGGHMSALQVAPNDPTFFLVHAWIDSIWELWRLSKQTKSQRETVYLSNKETCNSFDKEHSPLTPFDGKTVKDGLSNKYTDEFYSYQERPTCTKKDPTCQGSPYLYCDVTNERCLSKIRLGGNCAGFNGKDICYKSKCINGTCVLNQSDSTTTSTIAVTRATSSPAPSTTKLSTLGTTTSISTVGTTTKVMATTTPIPKTTTSAAPSTTFSTTSHFSTEQSTKLFPSTQSSKRTTKQPKPLRPYAACPYGSIAFGRCKHGLCGAGLVCDLATRTCCSPVCPNGKVPAGSCFHKSECADHLECINNTCCPTSTKTLCNNRQAPIGLCHSGMCPSGFHCVDNVCC